MIEYISKYFELFLHRDSDILKMPDWRAHYSAPRLMLLMVYLEDGIHYCSFASASESARTHWNPCWSSWERIKGSRFRRPCKVTFLEWVLETLWSDAWVHRLGLIQWNFSMKVFCTRHCEGSTENLDPWTLGLLACNAKWRNADIQLAA